MEETEAERGKYHQVAEQEFHLSPSGSRVWLSREELAVQAELVSGVPSGWLHLRKRVVPRFLKLFWRRICIIATNSVHIAKGLL